MKAATLIIVTGLLGLVPVSARLAPEPPPAGPDTATTETAPENSDVSRYEAALRRAEASIAMVRADNTALRAQLRRLQSGQAHGPGRSTLPRRYRLDHQLRGSLVRARGHEGMEATPTGAGGGT